ncbi:MULTISPECIES: mechanosensitive ion channel family protein [Oceanotoga]|jgi:small conductance mechanosensitive channel|uniref:Small conductance mechanosensitive channel n=1 Tax=Oceanotoga teriensis TaxID=515440 RepID=A0AA45C587_9BACT|nr:MULTISPECIES: mechanosensitive ion channel family protein [Oceanotoga]MDN5341913.1 small conductance mechanosensitive channel [Oceanotoga sp.]MDO7976575.1 mechanosensitive ion channel family protein [Oceanotoga teriensis]PWJ88257.1 small conductance mechanosensitive channel [Oceanotoga teriensis]
MNETTAAIISWIVRIGISFIIFIVAKMLSGIIYKTMLKLSEKNSKINLQYKKTMKTLLDIGLYTLAIFIIVSVLFKNLAPVLAGLGASSIIIGFAIKEPFENLICGILIMVNKLIIEGEAVEINGNSGSISEIKLNHVILKTWDGKLINIPSKSVWSSTVTHFWPENIRRNEISVGVAYDTDLNKAMKILEESVNSYEKLYSDDSHKPMILFTGYGSSSIDFIIRYWAERENYITSTTEIAKIIKTKFDENNIEIPFNQLDLHIKDGNIQ